MITFDSATLNISNGGVSLGHVIDAIRNGTVDASEAKGALDLAWIAREEAHQAAIAALTAQANEQIAAMQAAIDDRDVRLAGA